ncbi:MAG TPA: lysine--tRNA ligase [Candidatus Polarisedimenticolia bacterium]|nr:lysine--tRNA ligase [Candidatus Polarisedimenticolia bacterium]
MEWADELAARVSGPQVVNDSKTPSGTVHVGSLRGPVILDVITRALRTAGHETTLLYGVEDLDAMDAQALLTPDAVEAAMGMPLAHIPDQVADGHASYARHHAQVFIDLFADLGVRPDRYYWMSEVYATGSIDPYVRIALDRAAEVRALYRRVANVNHPETWHPVLVICETCGRVGTTIVTKWDGERVFYECRADLVAWARGCGSSGWVSPFGGRAKLPWNLEWAAQWSVWGVTIEPCGKDLATAGGSRDRADAIAREIFEREPPIRVDYEFLNVGGKKMSTSKGRGTAAHRIVEVLPPEPLRTLMIRSRPNHAIDFEPEGTDQVPRLFDEYDRLGDALAGRDVKGELPPGFASVFRYAQRDPEVDLEAEAATFRAPFAHLAFLLQVPGADVAAQMAAEKGSPLTVHEVALLDERVAAARVWLDEYAPERARMTVQGAVPEATRDLAGDQRAFLQALATTIADEAPHAGDGWQNAIFSTAASSGLSAGKAFQALYVAFLGRSNGPRAGWLLASLAPDFVVARLREAAAGGVATGEAKA